MVDKKYQTVNHEPNSDVSDPCNGPSDPSNISGKKPSMCVGIVKYIIDKKLVTLTTFAFLLLIVGIVLIVFANLNKCKNEAFSTTKLISDDPCDESEEASQIGLSEFLERVKDGYFEVFPEEIIYKPAVTNQIVRNKFKVHDPRPENLKRISDRANELL